MSGAEGDQFAHHMRAVAEALLGEVNKGLSKPNELRYGRQGSLSVDLERGVFFDHEKNEGGGVLDLIARETGRGGREAIDWLRENGFDVGDGPPPAGPPPGGRKGGARLDPNGNWLPKRVPDHGRLTATFDYRDDDGEVAYQVCRYDWDVPREQNPKGHDKTFVQRRPDPAKPGGWTYSTKGLHPLPYRLPELIEDLADGYEIFIVEGEKKVDMLRAQGVPATCNHGGAKKWPDDLCEWFERARVIIMADNDKAGEEHRDLVGRKLAQVAQSVRVLELPGLPDHGGVDDWIEAGGTAERLYDLAASARPFEAAPFMSRFGAVKWADLDKPGPSYDWLVKGALTKHELSMLVGESQSGKSFLAIDVALAVARGEPWFDRRVSHGGVIYQAGESALGVRRRRLPAYRKGHNLPPDPLPFVQLERPVDLFTDDTHIDALIDECRHWASSFTVPLELIVIDTFAKATPGANENDGRDISMVLERCDRLRSATGAHVMLVHHLNAGGTKARGHTSLFANVDNVITVRRAEDQHDASGRNIREWQLTKNKDEESNHKAKFVLRAVEIGTDIDGDPITSCIIAPPDRAAEGAERPEDQAAPPGGLVLPEAHAPVLRAIYAAIGEHGMVPPPALELPSHVRVVERRRVSDALRAAWPDDPENDDDIRPDETPDAAKKRRGDARRQAAARGRDYLFSRGVIGMDEKWIWLTGKRVRGFEPPPGSRRRRMPDPPPADSDGERKTGPRPADDLPFTSEDFA